jgi:hypothetical protein
VTKLSEERIVSAAMPISTLDSSHTNASHADAASLAKTYSSATATAPDASASPKDARLLLKLLKDQHFNPHHQRYSLRQNAKSILVKYSKSKFRHVFNKLFNPNQNQ